ncbi:MAG: FAD-binding protein [Chitinivibrionales bacterium]|nr:FAD-binding protein [Chitinivibrionales bacterium]
MSELIENFSEKYSEFLRDESRVVGSADTISFPLCEDDICRTVSELHDRAVPVTVQGARTGIAGGAVPAGGHVLNLSKMDRVTGMRYEPDANRFFVSVQPGVLLCDLNNKIVTKDFSSEGWSKESRGALEKFKSAPRSFFAPDPTETSASIGGMVSCNASGARSLAFGATRNHVNSLRIVFADGRTAGLRRGDRMDEPGTIALRCDDGSVIRVKMPDYLIPEVKNVLGYYTHRGMEPIDFFIGSDGTLGIISEIELSLVPYPAAVWGIVAFLPEQAGAVRAVRLLRDQSRITETGTDTNHARLSALEYFDPGSLDLLRKQKKENQAFSYIPDIPSEHACALYIEYMGADENEVIKRMERGAELLSGLGCDEDSCWAACTERELTKLKLFRHAVPEAVNLTVDQRKRTEPRLAKLGTDMAVPDDKLECILELYESDLAEAGLESVIFGHIGQNHLHVNILPSSMDEFTKGRSLYMKWARQVIAWGGSPAAEHGIGKVKKEFLKMKYGDSGVAQMLGLKRQFDPQLLLNRGNWFE